MTLEDAPLALPVRVESVGGDRAFRRRLMELGLLPGTTTTRLRVAPFGDPVELSVRGARLSIRRAEARAILVSSIEAETERARDSARLKGIAR